MSEIEQFERNLIARLSPRFRHLESEIERNAFTIGAALDEIRRTGMWKEHEKYNSFVDYLRGRWGMGKSQGYRLMEASRTVEEVSPMGDIVPTNERQARELGRADDPITVWQGVVAEHDPAEITAAVIREHVQRATGAIEVQQGAVQMTVSHSDRVLLALAHAVTAALQIATQDVVLDVVMEAMAVK